MQASWHRHVRDAALLVTAALYSAGYATVGLFLILSATVSQGLATRRLPWVTSALDWSLAAFLMALLVSAWASPYRPIAIGSVGLAALVVYLAYGGLVRSLSARENFSRPFLLVWFAGGIATAIWSGYFHLRTGMPAATPELGQNAVGTTLLIAFIVGFGLLAAYRSRIRYGIAPGLLLIGLALMFTYTRGAWLGTAAGIISLGILIRPSLKATAAAVVLLAISVTLPLVGAERGSIVQRAQSITNLEPNQDRLVFARTAWRIFLDHPVFGTGLNTFAIAYPRYAPGSYAAQTQPFAHNIWLSMAAESGVPGVLLFTWVVVAALTAGVKSMHQPRDRTDRIIQVTVLAALIGLLVHQLFDGTVTSVHLGVGLWFLAALLAPRRSPTQASKPSP